MNRRAWLKMAATATAGCAVAGPLYLVSKASRAQEQVLRIEMLSGKFAFVPNQFGVKKGQRVTVILTSPDFTHGFSIPDFDVRADGVPGKPVEVTFVAHKAGKFVFLCDNFCGEGHEHMSGFVTVTETYAD
jgi:cytochrome c oxidase subunit II